MTVNEYEVEIRIVMRNDEPVLRTATEYAYSPSDAVTQAIYRVGGTVIEGSVEKFDVLSVQPPKRLIEIASRVVQETVESMMNQLTKR